MSQVRTLPIHVPPHPGEALDSWLEALANRLNTHLADLLIALDLLDPDDDRVGMSPRWTARLHRRDRERLAAATTISPDRIAAMTLVRYHNIAVQIDSSTGLVDRHHLWGRPRDSRFCPDCLAESGGRWQLTWRLGWSFACPAHRRLLADACPECGRAQRRTPHPVHVTPHAGRCAGPIPGNTGLAEQRCGADLTTASTLQIPADHPALIAQQHLLKAIDAGTADFGVYREQAAPTPAFLSDVRTLAIRMLTHATDDELAPIVPADLFAAYLARRATPARRSRTALRPVDPVDRPGFMAPGLAVTAAVAVTAAHSVLGAADIPTAGEALRWLVKSNRRRGQAVSATTIRSWGSGTTPTLTGIQLSALDPLLKPSDQLRYRSRTPTPRVPVYHSGVTRRARGTPTLLWSAWFVRLALPSGHANYFRLALPCAIQLIGTRLGLSTSVRQLDSQVSAPGVSRILQQLENDPRWHGIYTALVRLADYLDTSDVPINYERRRTMDYHLLLPDEEWEPLCHAAGIRPGSRRAAVARSVLFERISGLPSSRAPFAIDDNDFRGRAGAFCSLLTPELAAGLDAAAKRFLSSQGIHAEPVTWHPPLSLLSRLELPGKDPSGVDVASLHHLVRQNETSLEDVAGQLGTTIDAVRHVLTETPAPQTAQPELSALNAARACLDRDELFDLYQNLRLSLREIAERVGVSRQTISRLAVEYDITLRPAARPNLGIDPHWLYEQYVVERRTLPDLARESGASASTLARWARTHGIPIRGRGGPSHHTNLRAIATAATAPALLRPALVDAHGWERLRRLAVASAYPTITAAAAAMGLKQAPLITQIHRLEHALGGQLLERAERGRPMRLTPLGRKVVAAYRHSRPGPPN
ncbi:TniQ family protein [Pseudonocardia sp. TRM90224]|uniref:TniQ family protein n=1 Tax=Pseudonocardia sp. TRM90224 TaxID=2812678 RepID=UPI001E37E162|nr:TniQ family protein [Pseudonocardia sp. TRM90224]